MKEYAAGVVSVEISRTTRDEPTEKAVRASKTFKLFVKETGEEEEAAVELVLGKKTADGGDGTDDGDKDGADA
jgi:GTP-sensing pleiotropic transcriptional regulator CodY